MLKKRLAAVLTVKNGIVVQSIAFKKYLPVGSVSVCTEFLNKWGIDEIIILDIDATLNARKPDFEFISKISPKIFVPLTVGGGIKSIDDMRNLIHFGADKFAINKAALENKKIITEAAQIFGAQCIVVSIDVKMNSKGNYEVYSDSGKTATGLDPVAFAKEAEELGAGEILLNSIDQDGSKNGYDLALIKKVSDAVNIPVIAVGGAGKPEHFFRAFESGASAAAAGNFFHFTEHSPILVKSYLRRQSVDVRLDTQASYKDINFDQETGRILKRPDEYLDKLRFEYIAEEII